MIHTLLVLLLSTSQGYSQQSSEEQIKIAYLYHIMRLVKWPVHAFDNQQSPFILCFFGRGDIPSTLDFFRGKMVQGRFIFVKYHVQDLSQCHLLFVSHMNNHCFFQSLDKLDLLPILTVGEHRQFCQQGGMINLAANNKNIILEINVGAIKQAGLYISSRLITIATVIETQK